MSHSKPRKQCKYCPWKVSTDPHDIPNGYCPTKHAALKNTVAEPSALNFGGNLRMMACHESDVGSEEPCIGWLENQLGVGNNIALRLKMMMEPSLGHFEIDGEQHPTLEDTLPG